MNDAAQRRVAVWLAISMVLPVAAQGPPAGRTTPEQRLEMFQGYLARRAAEISVNFLSDVKSRADWERKRPEIRRQLLYMLGLDPLPPRTPLNAQVTGRLDRQGYRVEKLVFESLPHFYVTANLYVPAASNGRLPAVVYLSGHNPSPHGVKTTYQHHGIWFARHGYLALILDTILYGEVPAIHHGIHDLGMWNWLSRGYTPAGPEVWNAIRAVDYLETRPEVDRNRIAVTGMSGGGAITWYSAAVDERFRVAAPSCSAWTLQTQAGMDLVRGNCDCIFFPNIYQLDLTAAGALIAPRPLKILNARRDSIFPPAGYLDLFRSIRPVYQYLDALDRFDQKDEDIPHQDHPLMRKAADEWINRWLKNDLTPFDEGQIQAEDPSALTVLREYPAAAINDRIHNVFVPMAQLQRPATMQAWSRRRAALLTELDDKVFRAFPKHQAPFEAVKIKQTGWPSRYADQFAVEFNSEAGVRITGQLFLPRDGRTSHPVLVYLKGEEDVIYPVDYDNLLPAFRNHVVLVLLPRAVDYPADRYRMTTLRRTAALIGATSESMQVWDLLRSLDYLAEVEKVNLDSVSVYARRQMGPLALYAAALSERIHRVILDDPPASHRQGPALLNILRITDIPEAAGLMAPREIVSLTPLPGGWTHTSSIYALYRKGSGIRRAGGLGEALEVWKYWK
jgi:cephalosporin-C deacetylase-like acetyl esterase